MRTSRRVGRPTAAVMRRTWRLRPSRRSSCSQAVGTVRRWRIGGWRSGRVGGGDGLGPRGQGASPLDLHPVPQMAQGWLPGRPLHLHQVAAPVPLAWIGEGLLQAAIAGEQQQPLAVGVESAGGVDVGAGDPGGQAIPGAAGFRRELAQHAVGLVEQQGGHTAGPQGSGQPSWRARQRLTTPIEISSRPRSIESGGRITVVGQHRPDPTAPLQASPPCRPLEWSDSLPRPA